MNRTIVLALIGAFFAALVVAMIVSAQVSTDDQPDEMAIKTVEILVANRDMPIGSNLSLTNTRWQKWPEDSLFADAVMKDTEEAEELMGKKTRRPLYTDEPVTKNAVILETTGGYMAAALEDGMRAVAVEVNANSSAGGFITPGDMVDVIMVYRVRARTRNASEAQKKVVSSAAETVLENVRVLAVDQSSDSVDDEAKLGKTVTLEVDSKGAEILALSQEMGDIYLSLRQLGEKTVKNAPGTTDVDIGDTLRSVVYMSGSGGPTNTVRVYNGPKLEDVPLRGGSPAAEQQNQEEVPSEEQEEVEP